MRLVGIAADVALVLDLSDRQVRDLIRGDHGWPVVPDPIKRTRAILCRRGSGGRVE